MQLFLHDKNSFFTINDTSFFHNVHNSNNNSEATALNFVALSKLPESALRSIRCLSGASSNGLADEGNL